MASSEASGGSSAQPNLHKQDLSKLNVTKLTPLSPEVISRQATINIGTIGHVAHGKSTVVKAISGVQTVRFKNELERNITIKLDKLQFDENGIITWPKQLKGVVPDNVHIIEECCMSVGDRRGMKRKLRRARPDMRFSTYAMEYSVEQILSHTWNSSKKTWMFLIKWKGYSMADNSWEPLSHLTHCTFLLNQYLTGILHSQLLDPLCEKLKISSTITNQELLDVLKITNLQNLPEKIILQQHLMSLIPNRKQNLRQLEQGQRAFLMYQLVCKRETQLKKLSDWEEMINNLVKGEAIIKVENNVDLEVLPEGFTYVTSYLATGKIRIPTEPTVFCKCKECGPKEKCCGKQEHNGFSYTKQLKVNVNPGVALHECNKRCKCGPDCRNRVIQKGRKVPLCIFRTSNGCGWGVKAMRTIGCGEFVCEYVGEVITHEEAEVRGKAYDKEGRTYLFDLDYNSRDNPYTVDAANFGNISHFINHSCDPNLGVYAVWINCSDPNLPKLALFALRKIEKNEEITFDYMMNIDPVLPTSPEKSRFLRTPDQNEIIQNGRNICKCEADNCRRYLF